MCDGLKRIDPRCTPFSLLCHSTSSHSSLFPSLLSLSFLLLLFSFLFFPCQEVPSPKVSQLKDRGVSYLGSVWTKFQQKLSYVHFKCPKTALKAYVNEGDDCVAKR